MLIYKDQFVITLIHFLTVFTANVFNMQIIMFTNQLIKNRPFKINTLVITSIHQQLTINK